MKITLSLFTLATANSTRINEGVQLNDHRRDADTCDLATLRTISRQQPSSRITEHHHTAMRIHPHFVLPLVIAILMSVAAPAYSQVPGIINYQGRVAVGGLNFDGTGQFKFALVNAAGTTTYWSNNGTSTAGSEPTAAVPLTVVKGRYSVLLGDASLGNMTTVIPTSVFNNTDVRLRVWFNDGTNGSQRLTPDQRLGATGYALVAGTVADGSITAAKIATGAIGSAQIANGAIGGAQIASGLTLAGTTSGTFSGALTGNVTGNVTGAAASAASFTGTLAGDVTGTQGATVVSTVGGNTAAFISSGATLANAATTTSTASAIVKRDGNGDFTTRTLNLNAALNLPTTTGATVGLINQNGTRLLHSYGTGNFFAGEGSGNFSLTGTSNTATGENVLTNNTSGSGNTASGTFAMFTNTTGNSNTAIGNAALNGNTTGSGNTAAGVEALLSNTTGAANSAFGSSALRNNIDGIYNTALGYQALQDNTSGSSNCALGLQSLLRNTTGSDNIGLGFQALISNTTGVRNIAIGSSALSSNTTASDSTAVGVYALAANTTGTGNSAFGAYAMVSNTTGTGNLALGSSSLRANTMGANNTSSGVSAMFANTMGGNNVAFGQSALAANLVGNNNTALGFQALLSSTGGGNIAVGNQAGNALTTGSNNIVIGHAGVGGESNAIRIGTAGTQTAAFIAGISGVTSSGGVAVFVNASGQLGTVTSSRRFKDDIQDMSRASESLLSLRPVTFRYKPEMDAKGIPQWGLIAEDVAEVNPDLVVRDEKGVIQTVRYEQVNAMLLNEFLKDHRRAAARDVEIADLKQRLVALEARDKEREARLQRLEQRAPAAETSGDVTALR